ncbi:MAG TPA: PaaX family transcriptional regulator C-terminal domain-containing protein [Solirubrobacteraceae bacterium]|nr:PaaX family transcriptional regulator C-terminal domain-containing protein [Solirubrobacteraceae bacterium]
MDDQLRRRSVGAPAARSLLLTILGEYVLPRGEPVWQETLVGALTSVGYTPQAARQALARTARDGWLSTERVGRRARMALSERAASMLRSGAERIYGFGEPWAWDGRWLVLVLRVPEERREVRHQLRTRLAWAGLGSLGGGVWLTPHVEREAELASAITEEPAAEATSFVATLGSLGSPASVAAAAWDLDGVREHYEDFVEDFARVRPAAPEAHFRMQTLLVHAWRKFPFVDPDLPDDLLPARWPRSRAHELFVSRHARWQALARAYFEELEAGRPAREAQAA